MFVFTKDPECKRLHEALLKTKLIDWSKPWLFYAIHRLQIDCVLKVVEEFKMKPDHCTDTDIWAIDIENALKFDVTE